MVRRPAVTRSIPGPLQALLGAALAGLLLLVCVTEVQAQDETGIPVPEEAPDTVPVGLFDDVDEEWQVPVDILSVTFTADATAEEKSEAAGIAGATDVVGGVRLASGLGLDGIYLFRIATDGTMQPLLTAIERLKELPYVVSAFTHSRVSTAREDPAGDPG